jgi:UDP-N-acetylmuramate--alanine ligase
MHFIGIGGIGMSGIAEILINLGYEVSGSDLHISEQTKRMESLGARVYIGHNASNIEDYSVVITSTAIDPSNPEIVEARRRKIPIIHRSEMLAELVRLKHGIGVAGTHGKTTTSSILSYVLFHGGINPTAVIGGKVFNFGSNARIGEGEYLVFEADESDGTFLNLMPTIGIVTNIDADHLDHYRYFENIKEAFLKYMNSIPFYGYSVICIDDVTVRELIPRIERPFYTYGFSEDADFRATNVEVSDGITSFNCSYNGEDTGRYSIRLLGSHNVVNAVSVIAIASELGLDYDVIKEGLYEFSGVGRRLEVIGEVEGIRVYDDYGHHPTEIRATLKALKELGRRLVVVFQPHRYTRTELLWDEFGQSFPHADSLYITAIYPAGEKPIEGVSSELIRESVKKHENREVEIVETLEEIPERVGRNLEEGDIVVTLGAGNIYKSGKMILDYLREDR